MSSSIIHTSSQNPMLSTSAAFIVLLSALLGWIWGNRQRNRHRRRISKDPAICHQIIAGKAQNHEHPNTLSPHEARGIPNAHIRIAFGIDNAFTRTDRIQASKFVNKIKPLINLSPQDWIGVSQFAIATTNHWINHGFDSFHQDNRSGRIRLNITSLAQILSLKVMLWLMFNLKDQRHIQDESLLNLAQSINRVWISSKLSSANNICRFEDDKNLQTSLFDIFGKHDTPEDNPLNLILPSFETTWRVVLRAFLELRFATGTKNPLWRETMIAFAQQPSKEMFERRLASSISKSDSESHRKTDPNELVGAVSAEDIVCEALRLYVPTRRVRRAYRSSGMEVYEIRSADIEGCHLRSDIWGSKAEEFDPRRWCSSTAGQRACYMPFGRAPFECPAKPNFGPRMIGVLVGSLLGGLEGDGLGDWSLECDDMDVVERIGGGGRLCPHRNAYAKVFLVQTASGGL
ncbi:Cytochrome P450 [Penicillium bovifimosum]|uniref:Cytochrome P450 n=1 Tax=Penicillium bovifimosum TaxID=126998 RepID=A0A9W9HBD5_9EURO|nr:Cytochrome P450 [Penicillium bovifimosum]KAJ5143570.1 Cytochrome P450 [Penicillium bovifimosum]